MHLTVSFPGGAAVDVAAEGQIPGSVRTIPALHSVHTDQPAPIGAGSGMSPFDLFFASIGACAGFYALRFCQERGISTEGLGLAVEPVRDDSRKRIGTVRILLTLPDAFPEKYRKAILRAIDQCSVKRHILEPPAFEVSIEGPAPDDDPLEVLSDAATGISAP